MIPAVVSLVPRPVQWPKTASDDIGGVNKKEEEEDGKKNNGFVGGGTVIVDVACGDHHTVAISVSGELYMWGLDQAGQCGGSGSHNGGGKPGAIGMDPAAIWKGCHRSEGCLRAEHDCSRNHRVKILD